MIADTVTSFDVIKNLKVKMSFQYILYFEHVYACKHSWMMSDEICFLIKAFSNMFEVQTLH